MSYSELRSHPNKKLEDHLKNVADFSRHTFNSLQFENNNLFSKLSFFIGICHDFAKSTSFFQIYLDDHTKKENTAHSFLSAIFTYYVIKNIFEDNGCEINLAIISYIVVLAHHGNLKNVNILDDYHSNKSDEQIIKNQVNDLKNVSLNLKEFYGSFGIDYYDFLDNFDDISNEIENELFDFGISSKSNFDYYFYILILYSVLLDADKMDASETTIIDRHIIPGNLVDLFKKEKFNNSNDGINKIREEAYQEVIKNIDEIDLNERIYSINLPTGIGKTFTGVSAVLKLKEKINDNLGFNPRFIYSLPFLSVIDQNEDVIKSILNHFDLNGSNYLIKHNHLSDMSYSNNNEEPYDISNSKILVEGWNSEIIVTTFIQFFYSIIGHKNRSLRKFHNITNSIILLDEIQSIPYNYWEIINLILKDLAYKYNCWIILMTATQPFIFKENEISSLVSDENYYFDQFDRIDYHFDLENKPFDVFICEAKESINESSKDIMYVLNTINSSKQLYLELKDYFSDFNELYLDSDGICCVGDDTLLIYLSTSIIPKQRLARINTIKNSSKRKIIITTQLIEAGVDIDVDVVYRDLAPLDSIIQTAGRCNRSGKKEKGIVNVISLINQNNNSYANFVYDSLLLNTTKEILKDYSIISEKEFNLAASNNYFNLISQRGTPEDIKDTLKKLSFADIPSKFQLIKDDREKISVFVCIDDDAKNLFNKYLFIQSELNGFKRKEEFLKIKSDFFNYVISVDERKLGSVNLINNELCFIDYQDLSRKYDIDLGFKLDNEEGVFII